MKGVQSSWYLMMVVRQSTRSCFFCLEIGPSFSGSSSSKAFGSSLEDFFFGSSLGADQDILSGLGKLLCGSGGGTKP